MNDHFEHKIDDLFSQLNNRRFGVDNKARNQIVQYFHIVTIEKRCQILRRLLYGNTLDRYAGYNCMEFEWDNSYEQFVEEMWHKYHDIRCARFICRYFPTEYIKEHLSDLASILKLDVDDEKRCFRISEKSSSENISIAIIANLKEKHDSKELREMLYGIIRDYTDKFQDEENPLVVKEFLRVYKMAKGKHFFTTRYIPGVLQILECMFRMGFQDALMEYHTFDYTNQMLLANNLWGLPVDLHPSKEEWIECWKWFVEIVQTETIKQCCKFDEDIYPGSIMQQQETKVTNTNAKSEKQIGNKSEILKKMTGNNSALRKLQDVFKLTINNEEP